MRLAAPGSSKRACCDKLSRHHGVEVNPDKFYRMMDAVNDDRIARLQSIGHEVRGLLQERVVLFFDVTTLFFASDKGDDLRKKGFSKDGKPQKVQVVLALQSVEGLPYDDELFPGSTTDVRTLKPALKALRERFERPGACGRRDAEPGQPGPARLPGLGLGAVPTQLATQDGSRASPLPRYQRNRIAIKGPASGVQKRAAKDVHDT